MALALASHEQSAHGDAGMKDWNMVEKEESKGNYKGKRKNEGPWKHGRNDNSWENDKSWDKNVWQQKYDTNSYCGRTWKNWDENMWKEKYNSASGSNWENGDTWRKKSWAWEETAWDGCIYQEFGEVQGTWRRNNGLCREFPRNI